MAHPYFIRCQHRETVFERGPRPIRLGRGKIHGRTWKAQQRREARKNPIRVARRFQAELERPSVNTFAQIADHFGVTRASVSQYITVATRLPEDFVAWLEGFNDPEFLAHFSLRRLLAIARVEDRDDQKRQLEELVEAVSDSIPCSGFEPASTQ